MCTDHVPEVYKVDNPILGTLPSSFMFNNISSVMN